LKKVEEGGSSERDKGGGGKKRSSSSAKMKRAKKRTAVKAKPKTLATRRKDICLDCHVRKNFFFYQNRGEKKKPDQRNIGPLLTGVFRNDGQKLRKKKREWTPLTVARAKKVRGKSEGNAKWERKQQSEAFPSAGTAEIMGSN